MTAPTKILFLDIDGVLNSHRTVTIHGGPTEFGGKPRGGGFPHDFSESGMKKFDPVAVALIRQVCIETDCSIVLSSAWRVLFSAHECANSLDLPIIDKTPNLADVRGAEIKAWLDQHPEVEHYAIVDDNSDMLESQRSNFVQTDGLEGLSYRDFCALRDILDGRGTGHQRKALVWEDM
ncbi:Phage protein [Caballeronia glathei]|uniref:Uncharacterized protein n=1 Tax=Caballeronia glathei TaxID=60547 RepID=A0A069PLI7_9BURK|nr:HAD domain-containing protein [Caballeronia glathei]KDR41558.1 hypothetical protein BG61_16875 [Caballeronia glathei]CDY79453.1 Phage protein [Caballeronia glathei]